MGCGCGRICFGTDFYVGISTLSTSALHDHGIRQALLGGIFDGNRPWIWSPTPSTRPRGTVPDHIAFDPVAIGGVYAENDEVGL